MGSIGGYVFTTHVPACGQFTRETAGQYFCCVVCNNSIIYAVVHLVF